MMASFDEPGSVLSGGASLAEAIGAIILLHGRGGSAEDILHLGEAVAPPDWALLAPRATGNSWYPYSFLVPRDQNEPQLTDALDTIRRTEELVLAAGIPAHRVALAGFSQGACLATEYVGRNPRKFAALLAFTGGLIGPLDTTLTLTGDLEGTPVFFASGDPDPHVPWLRVQQSAALLKEIGGQVQLQRYPGRPHTVSADELKRAGSMLAAL